MRGIIFGLTLSFLASPMLAQSSETLADIRQELTVLHVEMQKLKRELSTTGNSGTATVGGSVLERVDALEAELRRLTAQTEQMSLRIDRVVTDGTRRVGDLEFRLVELEGGDVSQLGETSTLGGGALPVATPAQNEPVAAQENMPELAVGETRDMDAARKSLEEGDFETAAARLKSFNETYPGSPLGPQAQLAYGAALEGQGDIKGAARAYLDAFRLAPNGENAPEALFRLGKGLGQLGQTSEACATLGEVGARFPSGEPANKAEAERGRLGCS